MEQGCEHADGSPIGKCAVCDRTVCSECYRDLFGTMICDQHADLEDESAWELIGMYTDASAATEQRFVLDDAGITSLVVDQGDEAIELYAPAEERDDAFAALSGTGDECFVCDDCQIQFSRAFGECPVCGEKPVEHEGDYEG